MFGFFHYLRRKKLLKEPLPPEWKEALDEALPFARELDSRERRGLEDHLKILVKHKHWEGAAGFELTEEVRLQVALQGARMARGLPLDAFARLSEIVIYGQDFVRPDDPFEGPVHGEAHPFGTVVLSWPACQEGLAYPCSGYNPMLHEFAHMLDVSSGYFDGTPMLHRGDDYEPWARVFQYYFEDLRQNPEASFLDLYAAEDEAEFFAVSTEAFFELPDVLLEHAPELYRELARFYRVEPQVIPCSCESHEPFEDDPAGDPEEVGRPLYRASLPGDDLS
ncbi:hypothetical protein DL240_13835 [Lujinxingia litoralis]|uniref:Zinc-dependent peptidase n=1 Tax=Lujinxingia litoralis TaxID=2211119 RepID=A0A328C3N7_9DELT|nr:M90 family metallopeptidase [Lujinxingia litoralis]RAL21208.1 hypothetical protein DL240_13835 [Lujinxingia litoralis]